MPDSGESPAVSGSFLVRRTRAVRQRLGHAAATSTLARTSRRVERRLVDLLRGSWLVAWLTAEPEPEVIVIDLRETWTVGPVLAAIDALAARVPAGGGEFVTRSVRRAASRPLQLVGVGLLAVGGWLVSTGLVAAGLVVLVAGLLSMFETRSWADLRETATGRLVNAVLAPPPPPEETTRR